MKLFVVLALALLATVQANVITPGIIVNSTVGEPSTIVAPKASGIVPLWKAEGRITNGEYAHDGQIPYQVGLLINGNILCGGSLISEIFVASAMHCLVNAWQVRVNAGSVRFNEYYYQTTVPGDWVIKHPHYNSGTLQNDIAIIRIPAFPPNHVVSYVRLPTLGQNPSYEGHWALASGWGKISDWEGTSDHLRFTWVPIISNAQCQQTYGGIIDHGTLCTGTPDGRSTCNGDSGGPLVADGVLMGITSFVSAHGCQTGAPAGFLRVSSYTYWIQEVTGIAYY